MHRRHLRELVDEVFRRGGFVRGVRKAMAVVVWPEVVGREVARFATAVAIQQGTLIVEVGDNETAMHLGLQRQRIIDAYRRRLGESAVRDLRFRVGRLPTPAPEPGPPPAQPDPIELTSLTKVLTDLPEHLLGPAAAVSRSIATLRARQRAAGWQPCPVCQRLTEPGAKGHPQLCTACLRATALPKVRTAATRLLTDPGGRTPALTDDERLAAMAIAKERAREAVAELLPQVVADPGLRPALAQLLRCAVALERGVGLAEVPDPHDIEPTSTGLDPRAWRVLGPRP